MGNVLKFSFYVSRGRLLGSEESDNFLNRQQGSKPATHSKSSYESMCISFSAPCRVSIFLIFGSDNKQF